MCHSQRPQYLAVYQRTTPLPDGRNHGDSQVQASPELDDYLTPSFDDLEIDTLIEELNVLDLEGHLFNFDPKHSGHRSGRFEFELRNGRSLMLRFDTEYGQPSLLAYRILQVVFKKLTEEGRPFVDTVSFSQRELTRLVSCHVCCLRSYLRNSEVVS